MVSRNSPHDLRQPPLRLGLPLGRVGTRSRRLASELLGFEIDPTRLVASSDDGHLVVVFAKHRDIPGLVADGHLDVGVTSLEWVAERQSPVAVVRQLDWCDTRVSLLVPVAPGAQCNTTRAARTTCVTEFPTLASTLLRAPGVGSHDIRVVSGSTEGMVPTLFDCAVDCVETGATAERHGLREAAVLLRSRTVVVVREEPLPQAASVLVSAIA